MLRLVVFIDKPFISIGCWPIFTCKITWENHDTFFFRLNPLGTYKVSLAYVDLEHTARDQREALGEKAYSLTKNEDISEQDATGKKEE